MLITADWVLPVSRPPVRNGAVLVRHGRITEVGTVSELTGLNTDGDHHDFPGCVLLPGLVNAHTHLSLTALGGLLTPAPLEQWLPRLVTAMGAWDRDDHATSAALGVARCLQAGVTVVGDITYGPEAAAVASDSGIGGTFFWEVLGVSSPTLFAELEKMEYPAETGGPCGPRIRCGLSPHSTYTCSPRLIAAMHEASVEFGVPIAMHIAESSAEVQLLRDGTGPLAAVAGRLAQGFKAPGLSPIAYVDGLAALVGTTVVHAGYADPTDIARITSAARGVVTCPRSNAFLSNPVAPVARLLRAGVPVGVGTDSSASNDDLDLMEDIRALHADHPSLPPKTLIQLATMQGAVALGVEDRFGVLEPGMQADLAIFDLGATSDPETDLVLRAGAPTLRAVLAAGVWRVLDGQLIVDAIAGIETAAAASRVRAETALSQA